jgi:hypothetical protein
MVSFRASLLSATAIALILSATAARAMDIKEYFKMGDQDRVQFAVMLLDSAEKALRDQGRLDLVMQLDNLFTDVKPDKKIADGTYRYLANLDDILRAELKGEAANPKGPSLQAERAFRDAAREHGITLPPTFETIASGFQRQFPLRDIAKDAAQPPKK